MTHWRAVALISRWEFLRFFKVRELVMSILFVVAAITLGVPTAAEGLQPERAAALLEPVALGVASLDAAPRRGGGLIAVVVGALVMSVFTGVGVLFSVITGEKTQRVTEAIVSAVSPQAWIDGKILGTSVFVLAYLVTYAIGFALAFALRGLFEGALPRLPSMVTEPGIMLVTLVAAALGFGLWFTLFAAVAATVSDPTTSSRGGFIMLPGAALSVGFLGLVGDVDGWLFRLFALFPLTSPSALPVRMLAGSVAAWEGAGVAGAAGRVRAARAPRCRAGLRARHPHDRQGAGRRRGVALGAARGRRGGRGRIA